MAEKPTGKPIALVTGANRGIGLAVVEALAKRGFQVILTARHAQRGDVAAERLADRGLDVRPHALDVTSEQSIATLSEFVRSRCGRLDVLINNAGILPDGHGVEDASRASVFNASLDTVKLAMDVNVYGPLLLAQELIPLMRQQGHGRIVNVSTGMAQLSDMGGRFPAYRLSKTALNALTRILAAETADDGILVNAVCPGWVRTDMGGPQAERSPEEAAEGIVWAATLPDDGPTGGFFRDGQRLDW